MATKKQAESGEVLVLRDCSFGAAGEVVTLSADDVLVGAAHGMVDANPAAVKAAKAA